MTNKMTFEQVVADNNYQAKKRNAEFEGQMKNYVATSKENDKKAE